MAGVTPEQHAQARAAAKARKRRGLGGNKKEKQETFDMKQAVKDSRKSQFIRQQREQEEFQREEKKQAFNAAVSENIRQLQASEGKRPALKDLNPNELPFIPEGMAAVDLYKWVLIRYRSPKSSNTPKSVTAG